MGSCLAAWQEQEEKGEERGGEKGGEGEKTPGPPPLIVVVFVVFVIVVILLLLATSIMGQVEDGDVAIKAASWRRAGRVMILTFPEAFGGIE